MNLSCLATGPVLLVAALLCADPALGFDLQGHRGARGLAPENTLPAFERALALGVDTLELDIGVTADSQVVISHDPHLNPAITRDATGRWLASNGPLIRTLTLAQLQRYDVGRIDPASAYAKTFPLQQPHEGARVPTLGALFERVKALGAGKVRFNIETKIHPARPDDTVTPEAMVAALLKVIAEAGMAERVTLQSFDWRTLRLAQQLAPGIPTAYLTNANDERLRDGTWTAGLKLDDHGSVPRLVKAAGGAIWSPTGAALTEAQVKEAHALGLKVVPWTINAPADMDRLIAWGVDGIITDYPDRLRAALEARKWPLPKPVAVP